MYANKRLYYLTPQKSVQTQKDVENEIDKQTGCFLLMCCIPLCVFGVTSVLYKTFVKAPYNGVKFLKNAYVEKKNLRCEQRLKRKQEVNRKQEVKIKPEQEVNRKQEQEVKPEQEISQEPNLNSFESHVINY
jgi:hypothetical protein